MIQISNDREIGPDLRKNKYVVVSGKDYSIPPNLIKDSEDLKASWDNLETDKYLQDGASFRERRFGLFYFLPHKKELISMPPVPYFQSDQVNKYAGGIMRDFAPLLESTSNNQFLLNLIQFNFEYFPVEDHMREHPWEVDVHQFRIIGKPDEQGEPTPEGIHHDDDDFNVIHLMQRTNVVGGVNGVYDNDKKMLASTTLSDFMDSVFVWDPYVMHGVTPIHPKDSDSPSIRDVMVIGYNAKPDLQRPG